MILRVNQELVHEALSLVGDVAVVLLVEASGQHGVGEFSLVAPMVYGGSVYALDPDTGRGHTVMSEKRQILTLGVGTWNSRHLGSGRIDSGLLAEQLICNLLVTNPDMHLTADRVAEDTVVLVAELPHGKPRAIRVNIVYTANIGNRRGGARHELEPGASRWLVVYEEVVE